MADDADAALPARADLDPILAGVLQSAARLQQLVPDAVLVGGSAAADVGAVASQVARQLFDPSPKDSRTVQRLSQYKGLSARWQDWSSTVETCRAVATGTVVGRP
ncbi:hypothetical protein BKD30_13950 [Tersicoccus phoenicis]|uniref:Uncharacterized protein n=1 Tax=Tersicoccus phoenicis TaxID=554083 RepID=A0A1R1L6Q5_9MICC|nr:hypothetical protein [Tersicoccus phoenicis]OMH23231.1 hypothetical protein BKD30_13950 [Tersicoccus phoenicis]